MRGLNLFDNLRQDVRFALRQLRKAPGLHLRRQSSRWRSACAPAWRSSRSWTRRSSSRCRIRRPSRLVGVYETVTMFPRSNLSYLGLSRLEEAEHGVRVAVGLPGGGVLLATPGWRRARARRARERRLLPDAWRAPILGRDFRPGEDLPSAPRTVILSYDAWQKRYGGAADVLGRTVIAERRPQRDRRRPAAASFISRPSARRSSGPRCTSSNACDSRRSCHNLYGVARLADGVSVETAAANVKAIAQQLEQQYPDSNRGQGATVVALTEVIVGNVRPDPARAAGRRRPAAASSRASTSRA